MLTLLVVSSFAMAQKKFTISGTLKDATNGETLIGATVQVKGTVNGTTSNVYGFYSLTSTEGKQTLVFSYIGYRSMEKEVDLTENLTIDFEMQPNSEQLREVVVEAEKYDKIDIQKPEMSVNKLRAKTIKEIPAVMGEVDIIKSIQLLPGVTNSGEGASGFNVRGGAEDQSLVLLDEAIIYNSSHLFGFFSVFNADAVKDIKLYKGGIPAGFGGRASSVLDVRQKDGNSKKLSASGGIGAISSRLAVEGPALKGKSSFLVAGRASYANLFLAAANNSTRVGFYDINFKNKYEINKKNKLYLSGYYGNDIINFGGIFDNTYGNLTGNVRWNHIFSNKLFSNLSLIYSKYNYDLQSHQRDLIGNLTSRITMSSMTWGIS